jgi:hypothetical protein
LSVKAQAALNAERMNTVEPIELLRNPEAPLSVGEQVIYANKPAVKFLTPNRGTMIIVEVDIDRITLGDLHEAVRDTKSYIVERILDMKINKSKPNKFGDWAFLTKWVGHAEPTWPEWSVMRLLDKMLEYLRSVVKEKYSCQNTRSYSNDCGR